MIDPSYPHVQEQTTSLPVKRSRDSGSEIRRWAITLGITLFLAAGLLEVVSILFRPVSLSFRLYGNVFAGETMLETMGTMVPGLGWLLPIPFYFMELLVGLVQALVFMLLTAVFTVLICHHEEPARPDAHA